MKDAPICCAMCIALLLQFHIGNAVVFAVFGVGVLEILLEAKKRHLPQRERK